MVLDTRIPLAYQFPDIQTPGRVAQEVMPLKQLLQEQQLSQAYVFGPNNQLDRGMTLRNLARVAPGLVPGMQHEWAQQDWQNALIGQKRADLDQRENERKTRVWAKVVDYLKKPHMNAYNAYLLGKDANTAANVFRQSAQEVSKQLGIPVNFEAQQWTPELGEDVIRGGMDKDFLQVAQTAVAKNPRLMTDEGVLVDSGDWRNAVQRDPEGQIVPTGPLAEADETKWYTLDPSKITDPNQKRRLMNEYAKRLAWGMANKVFTAKDETWVFPDAETGELVYVQNPFLAEKRARELAQKKELYSWQQTVKKPDTVILPGGANLDLGKYKEKIAEADAKAVSEQRQRASDLDDFAVEARTIVDLLQDYQGGPYDQYKAAIGQYLPGTQWGNLSSTKAVVESMRVRMAPLLRVPGSGATTDYEMRLYMDALPNLMQFREGRELIATVLERAAERAAISADIRNELLLSGKYSAKEHRRLMKEQVGEHILTAEELQIVKPGAKARPAAAPSPPASAAPQTKTIGGKTYIKRGNDWFEQQ